MLQQESWHQRCELGFLDIRKAFNTVPRECENGEEALLWKVLRRFGSPEKLLGIKKMLLFLYTDFRYSALVIPFPGLEKFNILDAVKISVGVGVQAIPSIESYGVHVSTESS